MSEIKEKLKESEAMQLLSPEEDLKIIIKELGREPTLVETGLFF